MFENAKWIWAEENNKKGDRVLFRKKFTLEKTPKTAYVFIGASDGYNLYVNGRLAVFLGGLPRESTPSNGYYDQIDIAKLLSKGENVLAFSCYYDGEAANGCFSAAAAGLLVQSPDLGLVSNASFEVCRPAGYGGTPAPNPSGLYAGQNVLFDASKSSELANFYDVGFASTLFAPATEHGDYPIAPFNELLPRAIPLFAFEGPVRLKKITKSTQGATDVYEVDLGGAVYAAPILELTALGTEKIDIRTDRYTCEGGFYDEKTFKNRRIEYVCKNGAQTYFGDIPLSGTKLIVSAPSSVKITAVSMLKSFYDVDLIAAMSCSCADLEKLYDKCVNTLNVCMRENLIDSPDRNRGVDLAAFSSSARAALYLYSDEALPLIKKAIIDNAVFSDTSLKNNAGSPNAEENPTASLLYLSEFGAVSAYYGRTGDEELLGKIHPLFARYLLLWNTDADGMPLVRKKGSRIDAGYNSDFELIETCLYYSAVKLVLSTAFASGDTQFTEALTLRAEKIQKNFESRFFKGEGYASGAFYDDRANAFAVLSSLANPSHSAALIKLFSHVQNANLGAEGYVLEAMCKLNAADAAQTRLLSRYRAIIESENPTMPELFFGGALCYGGSVSVLNVLSACFAGVKLSEGKRVTLTPSSGMLDFFRFTVPVAGGKVSGYYKKEAKNSILLDNACPLEVQLHLDGKIIKVSKGKSKYND